MSALKFSANVSWLFPEIPELPERIRAAAEAGFRAVEAAWPYECPLGDLRGALSEGRGLEMVLINTPPGDAQAGDLGLGAVPGRQDEFRAGLDRAVRLAVDLQCPRIHIMAGRVQAGAERGTVEKEMEETFVENLRYAADVLNKDVFHWQIMDGNLTENIKKYFPLIGHVQIAQVPHRHEPDSPGELNFPYLFDLLEELGYQGYVGCEYKPQGDTVAGLGWMEEYHQRRKKRAESD